MTLKEKQKKYFHALSDELSYFHMVLNHKLSTILNNPKLETDVIVWQLQCLSNKCKDCKYCRAGIDSAELVCEQNAAFDTNSANCRYHQQTIKEGQFTI